MTVALNEVPSFMMKVSARAVDEVATIRYIGVRMVWIFL